MVKTSAAAPETKPKTEAEAAPRQAVVKPPVKPISGGVLNGKATSLPVPIYPTAARNARASGQVAVEVVIDGSGKVISAKAMSGHALLQQAAVQAAQQARFTPTLLSGQPVKISGIINYNFSLQQ
jgi:protein TonB